MAEKETREEHVKRLEEWTSLDGLAKALRNGKVEIDRATWSWWRNPAIEEKRDG